MIILITGASHTGKTLLAQKMLEMRFAPPSGHRCVCQRTLGGDNGQHFNQSLCVQS